MDYNEYFKFFNGIVENKTLQENLSIGSILKSNFINKKNIIKRKIDTEMFVCEVKLSNKQILLVKDVAQNFLLTYTILIGEDVKLVKIKLNNNQNQEYICEENLLDTLKSKFRIDIVGEVESSELFELDYEFEFQNLDIIQIIRDYLSDIKGVNFSQIHITKGDKIELFLPSIKNSHLKLAKSMGIPLINLLINNFIRDSNINIYDNKAIQKYIRPFMSVNEKILWNCYDKNNLQLFKDINFDCYLSFNKLLINDKIKKIRIVNFDKQKLINEISNLERIKLSSNFGKHLLPLWRTQRSQEYFVPNDVSDFEEISGREFNFDRNYLNFLFILNTSGQRVFFQNKYLNSEFNYVFENDSEIREITFKTAEELVLHLMYNSGLILEKCVFDEEINIKLLNKFRRKIKYLMEKIVVKSIEFNKFPEFSNPKSNREKYFSSVANFLGDVFSDYKSYPLKNDLLKKTYEISNYLIQFIKNHKLAQSELFFLVKVIFNFMKILSEFDSKSYELFRDVFFSYFKEYNFDDAFFSDNKYYDMELVTLYQDLVKLENLSVDTDVFILIKNVNFDFQLLGEEYDKKILKHEPKYVGFVKPDIGNIKRVFKYTYEEVVEQLTGIYENDLIGKEIIIRGKNFKISNNYYTVFKKYNDYKVVFENKYFKVLKKN